MTKSAEVVLAFGPGEYLFRLAGAQIEALESECPNPATGRDGIGFGAIWQRVMEGNWFFKDLRNIIRHGLIGGGMGPVEANRLCRDYVDAMPRPIVGIPPQPDSPLTVAQAILSAAVAGIEEQPGAARPEAPELDEQRDFGSLRAMLLDFGIDPRAADTMTLGEVDAMMRALRERREEGDGTGKALTADEFEELKERMRETALPDEEI